MISVRGVTRATTKHPKPPYRALISGVGFIVLLSASPILAFASEWIRDIDNPVIQGVSPTGTPVVEQVDQSYYMWFLDGFDDFGNISLATSSDGHHWTRQGAGPVFGDGRQLALGTVLYNGSDFRMWYSWGGATGQIGYATSPNGVTWIDHGLVMDHGASGSYDGYAAEKPYVSYDSAAGLFKMWYTAGANDSSGRRIAYATSTDGLSWSKEGLVFQPGAEDWCSWAVGDPFVEKTDTGYAMWFVGLEKYDGHGRIGRILSSNGTSWDLGSLTLELDLGESGSWDSAGIGAPWLINGPDGKLLMFYDGKDQPGGNPDAIGIATPEPATLALLALGGLAMLARRKRRK